MTTDRRPVRTATLMRQMIGNTLGTFTNQLKTFALLAALAGLLMLVGGLIGGTSGLIMAFGFAMVMNVGVYWFSDRIAAREAWARATLSADSLSAVRSFAWLVSAATERS